MADRAAQQSQMPRIRAVREQVGRKPDIAPAAWLSQTFVPGLTGTAKGQSHCRVHGTDRRQGALHGETTKTSRGHAERRHGLLPPDSTNRSCGWEAYPGTGSLSDRIRTTQTVAGPHRVATTRRGGRPRSIPLRRGTCDVDRDGIVVRREENVWWADGGFNNAYRAAGPHSSRGGRGGRLRRHRGQYREMHGAHRRHSGHDGPGRFPFGGLASVLTLGSTDATVALVRTPGPPPGSRTLPLSRLSPEVAEVSEATGVDLAAIAGQIRPA